MKETRICANCGAEHPIDDIYQVEGDWLCEDCADRLTVICDHCAERVYEENAVEDDTHTLCDRAYWDNDDNVYCADCWDDHHDVIHEYSYTPDLVFHGKSLRHFGVELEIDDGGTVNSNAQKLLDIANANADNLYIKTDSSLDEGLRACHAPHDVGVPLERNAVGRGSAVQPPHAEPDESLGRTVRYPSYAVRADEPRQEFLCRALYGGQSHECRYR